MATSTEYLLLYNKPIAYHYNLKEQQRILWVYCYIEENYQQKITVEEMTNLTSLTTAAFGRYFKK